LISGLGGYARARRVEAVFSSGVPSLHAKKAATMHRMIRSRHNPLTNHPGIPAVPQCESKAATTARMSIVTAQDNIFCRVYGLKRAMTDAVK
jgi:hypothetical protein